MNTSLDGYVEGPDGTFGWTTPDEEVFRFHIDQAAEMGGFLYGRRMYETMKVWHEITGEPPYPPYFGEFGRIWREKPKVVFSTTLREVGPSCRLVSGDVARVVADLEQQPGGDLGVSGPGLATSLAKLGLVEEYRVVVFPVIVGAGKPYAPSVGRQTSLHLVETRSFRGGAVYLRYRVERG